MNILCCIPARFNSSRLNGKPLLKINGIPIIQHTYRQALKMNISDVVVLTDDERIYDVVRSFNGKCAIIKEDCLNGTERICLYLKTIDHSQYDLVLNIQGDEPFINPDICKNLIEEHRLLSDTNIMCSTIAYKTTDAEEIHSYSRGKVVVNNNNNVMYCSRNIIPISKHGQIIENYMYNIHVGVFLFNKNYLVSEYMSENTPLQMSEDIEWLKIIEQGHSIHILFGNKMERGVDTQEDFDFLNKKYGH